MALPEFLTDIRPPAADPYVALAKAADLAGLSGVVVPNDPDGPEPLVTAAGLVRVTRHATVFAEVRPGIATPQYTAKFSATLQRFSGGRFGWYVGDDADSTAFVETAREFWDNADGLPDVLSEHAFPQVAVAKAAHSARLEVQGLAPAAVAELIDEHAGFGVTEFYFGVGHDPGEIYRIGEYVLPQLSQQKERETAHVG
ncbi:LLM class flavin-dependent oxidoreductase [Catenulispora yoronensis]